MTLADFKFIYHMEYGHRMLGRIVGVAFVLPALYFAARGRIKGALAKRCIALGSLGAAQVCFVCFVCPLRIVLLRFACVRAQCVCVRTVDAWNICCFVIVFPCAGRAYVTTYVLFFVVASTTD